MQRCTRIREVIAYGNSIHTQKMLDVKETMELLLKGSLCEGKFIKAQS